MRILRAAVAVFMLAVVLAPLSFARSAEICPGVTQDGYWQTIEAPQFPNGPQQMTRYEVNAVRPTVLFATNGVSLMMTEDRGCNWTETFSLGLLPTLEAPASSQNSEIVDIVIPDHPATNNRVYLAISSRVAGLGLKPFIVGSTNYGTGNWRLMSSGLQTAIGEPLGIHVSHSSPNFVYFHLLRPGGGDELWASQDAGENWQKRTDGTEGGVATDMLIDELSPDDLWFWGPGGVYHSTNGGRTRTFIDAIPPGIPIMDVMHLPGRPAQVMVYEPETGTFSESTDGGRNWVRKPGPLFGNAQSLTHGSLPNEFVFSQHQGVWRYLGTGRWLEITPKDYDDLYDLQADRLPEPNIYGRSYSTIHIFSGLRATDDVGPIDVQGGSVSVTEPTLTPEKVKMKLKPKQRQTIPFDLALPAKGTPLDVFFLVDTSESQDPSIAALRSGMQEIINELGDSGIDVEFGVGEFKDYPIPGFGDVNEGLEGDFPYRLNRQIGPVDESLETALERLQASGGGDQPESQLTGLYQAATGSGDPGFVPEGQDAGFRPQALKVVVHITDAQFHDGPQHPSPAFDAVASALRERDVLQVGLSVYGPNGPGATDDLTQMAEETETFAPVPVDCDENGSHDVHAGEALVCPITDSNYDGSLNLTPAIIATLKAVTREVTVELSASGGTEVLDALSPEVVPAVDLKNENALTFDVTFDCPPSMFGRSTDLTLTAMVRGIKVDTSTARVICKPPPTDKKKKEPPVPPHLVAPAAGSVIALLFSPPPPPPPIVENITASQNAAQAQGAIATEHQEELQLAVARQSTRFTSVHEEAYTSKDDLQMSAFRSREESSPALLYLSAGIMAAAFGAVSVARARARAAYARRRR